MGVLGKIRKIVIAVTVLLLLVVLPVSCNVYRFRHECLHEMSYYESDHFRENKAAFDFLAKEFSGRFYPVLRENEQIERILILPGTDSIGITYLDSDRHVIDEYEIDIASDEQMQSCIKAVYAAFRDLPHRQGFLDFSVCRYQVAFVTNGPYAIVYSGHRPDYIVSPAEGYDSYYSEWIGYHWYQILGENKPSRQDR